jgi:hypothetical protein
VDRRPQQVEPFPRVLALVLEQHLHVGTAGVVDDAEAGAVEDVSDRQRHSGLHPHPPEALLAVAQG